MQRRTFLQVLGGATLLGGPLRALAAAQSKTSDEFFIFIHAAGGWDVTLWADPRNERKGLVEPASTDNTDLGGLTRWKSVPLDSDTETFELVRPPSPNSNLVFGPGIGDLADLADRILVVNGLAMNTVSHPDGTVFSATGRHLQGGRAPASSIDTVVANELGAEQLFPVVSVQFPSSFVGDLDRRVLPLRVGSVGTIAKSLARSDAYETTADRDAVEALLSEEASELADRSTYPDVWQGQRASFDLLPKMLGGDWESTFATKALQAAHPEFDYKAKFGAGAVVNAAFAVEAMKRNLVRCTSFALGGFDTHNGNYRFHARTLEELFGVVATLVKKLEETPHPTRSADKLADHTHILVISDFCRTPQINLSGGRDHYPNNSALVISPRFKANTSFGSSDAEQVLPAPVAELQRPIAPPDLIATFLSAFAIDPRPYVRDGVVVKGLLRG